MIQSQPKYSSSTVKKQSPDINLRTISRLCALLQDLEAPHLAQLHVTGSSVIWPGMSQEEVESAGLSSLTAAAPVELPSTCETFGCHPYFGQIKCEFYRRKKTNDKKKREEVIPREPNNCKRNTGKVRWKEFCFSGRVCPWQVNYTYGHTRRAFELSAVCLQHEGHKFESPSPASIHLTAASQVSAAMWKKLDFWVKVALGGRKLRIVRVQSKHSLIIVNICSQNTVKMKSKCSRSAVHSQNIRHNTCFCA